jgi:hypothetical protein
MGGSIMIQAHNYKAGISYSVKELRSYHASSTPTNVQASQLLVAYIFYSVLRDTGKIKKIQA